LIADNGLINKEYWSMEPENHPPIADPDTRAAARRGAQQCIDQFAKVDSLPVDEQVWARPLLKQCAAIAETVLEQVDEAEQKGGSVSDMQKPQATIHQWVRVHEKIRLACSERSKVGLTWPPVVIQPPR
jgi:hypothetical protein